LRNLIKSHRLAQEIRKCQRINKLQEIKRSSKQGKVKFQEKKPVLMQKPTPNILMMPLLIKNKSPQSLSQFF
jgi:hypothetical protein